MSSNASNRLTNSFGMVPFTHHDVALLVHEGASVPPLPVEFLAGQQIERAVGDQQQIERGPQPQIHGQPQELRRPVNNAHLLPQVAQNSVSTSATNLLFHQFRQPYDFQSLFMQACLAGNARDVVQTGADAVPMEEEVEAENNEVQGQAVPARANWLHSSDGEGLPQGLPPFTETTEYLRVFEQSHQISAGDIRSQLAGLPQLIPLDEFGRSTAPVDSSSSSDGNFFKAPQDPEEDALKLPGSPQHKQPSALAPGVSSAKIPHAKVLRLPVAIPCFDGDHFSPFECLARHQMEFFANPAVGAAEMLAKGRPDITSKVGIQCSHCAAAEGPVQSESPPTATYQAFPSRLSSLREVSLALTKVHLCEACPRIPQEVRSQLLALLPTVVATQQADRMMTEEYTHQGSPDFWAVAASSQGIMEVQEGLCFSPDLISKISNHGGDDMPVPR
ncbi:expressed unknown protein [Seminavis robusta]|uniref:Uncharacterized protein n=1 Tax=Seminavis robusta TaxID=568900 RepID=A0A9N8HHW1_9STRA|nr:expressed unknown protein [Seminavis robusta]|eukprot:Sro736_g194970.1 n/a (446) ;mRNA; f:2584-3921